MLLDLFKRKRRITSDVFAQMLWRFSCLGSLGLYKRLKPQVVKAGYLLSTEEDSKLFREVVIANLWTVHASLSPDRNVLCSLHQIVTSAHQNPPGGEEGTKGMSFTQSELRDRYEKYDSACDVNSGGPQVLAATMLEYMLPAQKACLDPMVGFVVMSYIRNTIEAISELRGSFKIAH